MIEMYTDHRERTDSSSEPTANKRVKEVSFITAFFINFVSADNLVDTFSKNEASRRTLCRDCGEIED